MKIENVEVYGFRAALRGMRNPMDSWDKGDTVFDYNETIQIASAPASREFYYGKITVPEHPVLGPNDLKLACKLVEGGSEHRKFLRQIQVWFDITVPRYVWTELDTYKIATVRNSCSTMHKLGTRDLAQADFELPIPDYLLTDLNKIGEEFRNAKVMKATVKMNELRHKYKNLLPEGFLQKATFTMNYETVLNMYHQRKNHRLPEWKLSSPGSITSFLINLPFIPDFTGGT